LAGNLAVELGEVELANFKFGELVKLTNVAAIRTNSVRTGIDSSSGS
jgi:hypothetical protein